MTYPPQGPDDGWAGRPPQSPPGQPPGQLPGQSPGQFPGQPPGGAPGHPYGASVPQAVCSWHHDRATGLLCTRCGRPACPECLTPASVGQHCRQCVAEGRKGQRVARTVSGAPMGVPPLIASVLIGLNLVAYIVTAINAGEINHPEDGRLFSEFALIPLAVGEGEYWRILSSGFLHYGVIHLAANMLSLYFLGPTLEQVLGRWRFLAVYLVSLIGGSAAVMLLSDERSMSAGASGAIFGLMGALIVTFKRLNLDLRQLGFVLVMNLVITFSVPGISWQAHLGGLVAGAAIGAAMVLPSTKVRLKVQIGATIGIVAVCAALIVWKGAGVDGGNCFYDADGLEGPGVYCYTTPS